MESEVLLPFDPVKQGACLGHLITNDTFFLHARTKIRPEWFKDLRYGRVYKAALEFAEEYGRRPTPDELIRSSAIMSEPSGPERNALQACVREAMSRAQNYGLDVIRAELTHWLHARIYIEGVAKSKQAFNSGDYQSCYRIISDKVAELKGAKFDEDLELSFASPEMYLKDSEKQYRDALTWGLSVLDDTLTPSGEPGKGGGLFRGDTTVVLAPSNVGKTTTLITVARHNIRRGKDVLFMTHEGRPEDIREKFLCSMLGISKPELFTLASKPDGLALLQSVTANLTKHLTYIPYNKAGMTVEDVVPIIRRRQEERVAKTGKGFDLLVSDYPAKLNTVRAGRGTLAKRNIDAIVYDNYVQLALELQFHSLLAIQTNRQGSIANRDDERILTMEDVLESWDVMAMATNVITANRDPRAQAAKRIAYHVAKSRSSETGWTVVARTNFAACLSHSNEMGGVRYRGTDTLSDQIDGHLMNPPEKGIIPDAPRPTPPTSSEALAS